MKTKTDLNLADIVAGCVEACLLLDSCLTRFCEAFAKFLILENTHHIIRHDLSASVEFPSNQNGDAGTAIGSRTELGHLQKSMPDVQMFCSTRALVVPHCSDRFASDSVTPALSMPTWAEFLVAFPKDSHKSPFEAFLA